VEDFEGGVVVKEKRRRTELREIIPVEDIII